MIIKNLKKYFTFEVQVITVICCISTKIRTRRRKLAGHCARRPEEAASNLVLWVGYQIGVAEEGDARLAPSSTL